RRMGSPPGVLFQRDCETDATIIGRNGREPISPKRQRGMREAKPPASLACASGLSVPCLAPARLPGNHVVRRLIFPDDPAVAVQLGYFAERRAADQRVPVRQPLHGGRFVVRRVPALLAGGVELGNAVLQRRQYVSVRQYIDCPDTIKQLTEQE